jgi:hypothetical protein
LFGAKAAHLSLTSSLARHRQGQAKQRLPAERATIRWSSRNHSLPEIVTLGPAGWPFIPTGALKLGD